MNWEETGHYSVLLHKWVSTGLHLTSHGAEAKLLVSVIVRRGSTPLHVVSPALRSTVRVVVVVVQEGEVAQGTIGIPTSSLNQNCPGEDTNRKTNITTELLSERRALRQGGSERAGFL